MKDNSIFEYKYSPNIVKILDFLKQNGINYIEISPIIPEDSEMWLPLKKEFNNKGIYTIANYDLNFNIINKLLLRRNFKNCFTALKGINKYKECDYIFIQCTDIKEEVLKNIYEYLNFNKYKYKTNTNNEKIKRVVIQIS